MDICLYMYKLLLNSVYILFHECKNTTLRLYKCTKIFVKKSPNKN